jgi:hypothetical protein
MSDENNDHEHDDDVKCPKCGKDRYELHNSDGYAGMYCAWCAEAKLAAANEKLTEVVKAAEEAGWNGVDNSKLIARFITNLAEDLAAAQAIVDKLPKTKDGVVAYHGMRVWSPGERRGDYGTATFHVCEEGGFTSIRSCYSTPEAAALAAKEANNG